MVRRTERSQITDEIALEFKDQWRRIGAFANEVAICSNTGQRA